jgi:hypothetical protein
MSRYYTLVGKLEENTPWEIVFGAYDREDVEYEKEGEEISWHALKIVTTAPGQAAIDAKLAKLNKPRCHCQYACHCPAY